MTSNTPIKHLLGIKGLSASHIQTIFETADNFKELLNGPVKKTPALRDITIANLFFENSTRTRVSFELAEKRIHELFIGYRPFDKSKIRMLRRQMLPYQLTHRPHLLVHQARHYYRHS
jgi:aspartate carbamoyltransferase catalytic subunit